MPIHQKHSQTESPAQLHENEELEGRSSAAPAFGLSADAPSMPSDNPNTQKPFQLHSMGDSLSSESPAPFQLKSNDTGLPDQLKAGVEELSGFSMDDVKVHYNSDKPAQMQAHAFAQGTEIHVAPGQEKHLPEEAWHVTQQKAGRVQANGEVNGQALNDEEGLESEARTMGGKAAQMKGGQAGGKSADLKSGAVQRSLAPVQRVTIDRVDNSNFYYFKRYTPAEQALIDLEKRVREKMDAMHPLAKADEAAAELGLQLTDVEGRTIKDMEKDGKTASTELETISQGIDTVTQRVLTARKERLLQWKGSLTDTQIRESKSYMEYVTFPVEERRKRDEALQSVNLLLRVEEGQEQNLPVDLGPAIDKICRDFEDLVVEGRRLEKEARDRQREARLKEEAERQAKILAEEREIERLEQLRNRNSARCKQMHVQLRNYAGGEERLGELLDLTPRGEEGRLLACSQNATAPKLKELLALRSPNNLNPLLSAIGQGKEDTLKSLLLQTTSGHEGALLGAMALASPGYGKLVTLLTSLNKNAKHAQQLLGMGGQGSEDHLISLLASMGGDLNEVKKLLNTKSGTGNAKDASIIQTGLGNADQSEALLNAQGVRGAATDSLGVLAHNRVNNDMNVAVDLLDRQGNGTDVLKLMQAAYSNDDIKKLVDKPKIKGTGADVVQVLALANATVDKVVELLEWVEGDKLWSYMDPTRGKQTFLFVYTKLKANSKQTFWTGSTCATPAINDGAPNIQYIINHAVHPPQSGKYAGGNNFGNFGGLDGMTGKINMCLPGNVTYKEYDLAHPIPQLSGAFDRGQRRFVRGSDGSLYYTTDHYATFSKF